MWNDDALAKASAAASCAGCCPGTIAEGVIAVSLLLSIWMLSAALGVDADSAGGFCLGPFSAAACSPVLSAESCLTDVLCSLLKGSLTHRAACCKRIFWELKP